MLKSQGVKIFTGVVFSNVAVAMIGDIIEPVRGADGALHLQTLQKIRSHAGGAYAENCPMR